MLQHQVVTTRSMVSAIYLFLYSGADSNVTTSFPSGTFGEVPVPRLPRAPAVSVVHGKGIRIHFYREPNVSPL